MRDGDRQAFPDDPAIHFPPPGYLETCGLGGFSKERKRSVLPGELLRLRSGVLPGFFGKAGVGDKMQESIICLSII